MNNNKETKEKDTDWWIPLFSAFLMNTGNSQSNIELEKKISCLECKVSYLEGKIDALEKILFG